MRQNLEATINDLRHQATELTRAADILENASNSSGRADTRTVTGTPKTGRKMSASARRRIAKAQKERWAKWKVMKGGKTKAA